MKITKLYYNRHQGDRCEEYSNYEVGVMAPNGRTPIKITEHQCSVEGDKWYYNVHFKDRATNRLFNQNEIMYEEER